MIPPTTSTANPSDALPSVHLFNPANDEALASDNRWHTPSSHALQYQRDCELLPIWWAKDGDYIIAPNHSDSEIASLSRKANVDVRRYQQGIAARPEPWGWSKDAKRQLGNAGVPSEFLPTDEDLSAMRKLSHRRLAIDINDYLTKCSGIAAPNHPQIFAESDATATFGGNPRLLKRPWSSSGRGVFPTSTLTETEVRRLAEGIIKRQGSVIAEVALPKVMDLSALFYADDAGVRHYAWSVFQTTTDGRYMGSIVAPQSEIIDLLQSSDIYYGTVRADFDDISRMLVRGLHAALTPGYKGWIGVDMLAYREPDDGKRLLLAPCIEVNLRMTMGIVATILASNPLIPLGRYVIRTVLNHGDADSMVLAGSEDGFSVVLQPINSLIMG